MQLFIYNAATWHVVDCGFSMEVGMDEGDVIDSEVRIRMLIYKFCARGYPKTIGSACTTL